MNNQNYMKLVTHEYSDKPKFNELLLTLLNYISDVEAPIEQFDSLFNIENAVGDQLDKLGYIAGISRVLPIDDADVPTTLDDETYRKVIKAKIHANSWDGTREGLESIIEDLIPESAFEIVDNQDMSIDIVIVSADVDIVIQKLLSYGYILPKPFGVKVNWSVMSSPLFGHDVDNAFIKGYDEGMWSQN